MTQVMTGIDQSALGTGPMVRIENVHKSFGRLEVLKGIDLEVRAGEVCVVVGPSGSGKSTLLRCVNHLEKINAGRIWVDGDLIGYRAGCTAIQWRAISSRRATQTRWWLCT